METCPSHKKCFHSMRCFYTKVVVTFYLRLRNLFPAKNKASYWLTCCDSQSEAWFLAWNGWNFSISDQGYLVYDALAHGWKGSKTFSSNLWPITAFNFILWVNDWLLTFYENLMHWWKSTKISGLSYTKQYIKTKKIQF